MANSGDKVNSPQMPEETTGLQGTRNNKGPFSNAQDNKYQTMSQGSNYGSGGRQSAQEAPTGY